jgi:hypothetical protein
MQQAKAMAGLGRVGVAVPGVPAPQGAAAPAINPVLPPALLPAYLVVPSPAHGEVSRVVTASHGGDLLRFTALINVEMQNMVALLNDPNGTGLLAHALGVQTGPCAFLAVVPSGFTGHTRVVHLLASIHPGSQPGDCQYSPGQGGLKPA